MVDERDDLTDPNARCKQAMESEMNPESTNLLVYRLTPESEAYYLYHTLLVM